MSRSRRLAIAIDQALQAKGLKHRAVLMLADDETMDDDIEIHFCGVATSLAVQVGPYGPALNEYGFTNGELDSVRQIWESDDFAVEPIVKALVKELTKRGTR